MNIYTQIILYLTLLEGTIGLILRLCYLGWGKFPITIERTRGFVVVQLIIGIAMLILILKALGIL